jgi:hypothetical protein
MWVVGSAAGLMIGLAIALEVALAFSKRDQGLSDQSSVEACVNVAVGFSVPEKNVLSRFASENFLTVSPMRVLAITLVLHPCKVVHTDLAGRTTCAFVGEYNLDSETIPGMFCSAPLRNVLIDLNGRIAFVRLAISESCKGRQECGGDDHVGLCKSRSP